jgi:hypothetical protein
MSQKREFGSNYKPDVQNTDREYIGFIIDKGDRRI